MALQDDVFRIINKSKASVKREKGNRTVLLDSHSFKGLPLSAVQEITALIDNDTQVKMKSGGRKFATYDSVLKESEQNMRRVLLDLTKPNQKARSLFDSISNPVTDIASTRDPTMYSEVQPNIYISPFEAATLYSQKGLPELVINKKAKSILLNGLKIKNAKLSAKQIDAVSLTAIKRDLPKIISDAIRDSLVYGGDLLFPMFKKDTPGTTLLSCAGLIKQGVLAKDSIDYFISLDRWNTVHLPFTNPTQKDYLDPEKYFIPYLGADVHRSRCSRLVTGAQSGFWGNMPTLGWGVSDFCGYLRSMQNYKIAVQTIPLMIQQMSIIARTIDVSGVLAAEGANALDDMADRDTVRYSEWSPTNPVTLDLIGQIQVINRQFAHVPELLRLLRQDFASDTNIPEPMLFSSEKGNFSSGDDTEGNLTKQYESVKYIHKDVESQMKRLAQILIIDALGTDDEIIMALPYTEIHFDTPVIANSVERAEIGKNIADTFFQYVAGQMPVDKAAELASVSGGDELSINSELLEDLKRRQKESDDFVKAKQEKELELLDQQIKGAKEGNAVPKASVGKSEGYSKLEQEKHEKTKMPGEKRSEQLKKSHGKIKP